MFIVVSIIKECDSSFYYLFIFNVTLLFNIDSTHNVAVRSFLYQELQKESNGHKKSTIMRKSLFLSSYCMSTLKVVLRYCWTFNVEWPHMKGPLQFFDCLFKQLCWEKLLGKQRTSPSKKYFVLIHNQVCNFLSTFAEVLEHFHEKSAIWIIFCSGRFLFALLFSILV